MKDLITVFSYCPDFKRKKILQDFLETLQKKRDIYDILVVSHSTISDLSYEMIDYFYFDKENKLLKEFDLTNKFWFRSGEFRVNSSVVYPVSTHLAIYKLIYFTMAFAKNIGYKKIHFIEYDISMNDISLIDEVSSKLDLYDNVMFKGDDNWIWGTYFASNIDSLDTNSFIYDEKNILDTLIQEESRMTENITHRILSQNSRTILFESIEKIDKNKICQKNDEHLNFTLKWCVPVIEKETNQLFFFVYNDKGGQYNIDVFIDNKCQTFESKEVGYWFIVPLGDLQNINKIEIFVDKKLRNTLVFDDINREKFKQNNFFYYEK